MTARMIVTAMLVGCDPVGAGAVMGMSPARAAPAKTHVRAKAINTRFIGILLLEFGAMQNLRLQTENTAVSGKHCKV
jgi:hypothetical protein